jgi:NADPH2:quinone reductase
LFQLAQARAGESVLIHGASGGVGVAAVQFARAQGLQVLGTAGTSKGRDLVLQNGAHHVLDHTSEEMPPTSRQADRQCWSEYHCGDAGQREPRKSLAMVAKRGKIIVVGNRRPTELNIRDAITKGTTILAMVLFNATPDELSEGHAAVQA